MGRRMSGEARENLCVLITAEILMEKYEAPDGSRLKSATARMMVIKMKFMCSL